ncbi:MAG: pilus assembly protein [Candidatus Accumulibacter sp.]|nr:pilus assembly protein [Accumulibacter sp.]
MAKKICRTANNFSLRISALAVASTLVFAVAPWAPAEAAGLGKIKVLSALGQPLRAEVEVFATRAELAEMKAQLASPEEFKRAGVDYASTLLGIRFSISKSASGQAILKLTSDRPIDDPFVDLLVELNWPAGRLIRDYTFLLDPPEFGARAAAAAPAVVTRPLAPARPSGEARVVEARPARVEPPRPVAPTPGGSGAATYEVKRGDTLSKIARETQPAGVSLDQMLVGLFRANEDAFDRGNMNRLRAGKILSIPEKGALEAISADEARQVVRAQSSDWGAYRRKLAATAGDAPAVEEAARQQAAGKITTRVEDKAGPASEARDQLKVSKGELAGGGKPMAVATRSDEDLIAKEKALREANERLAALEKNVAELQRLVELKSQSLAELEKQAVGKPTPTPTPAPAVTAAPPPASAEAAAAATPLMADKAAQPTAEPAPPMLKPEEPKPEPKAEEPKPVAPPTPAPAPKPKVVVQVPAEEPSFLEDLFSSTGFLAGAGGIVALLAAYWLAKRRRQGEGERPLDSGSTLAPQGDSLVANSVFRNTGGQTVDTSHSMAQTDFSQAGPGSIDTDEVDPVAEADVYMAYGRDAQAEEILLEARQKDPDRHAIHLKLLEIYFGRRDIKPFDALATELFNATGGVGSEWEKAAAMGLQLDPRNALFGAAGQDAERSPLPVEPEAPVVEAKTMVVERQVPAVEAPEPWVDTVTRPDELARLAQAAGMAGGESDADAADAGAETEVVDRDAGAAAAARTGSRSGIDADLADLDFDLGADNGRREAPAAADDAFLETTLSFPNPSPDDALDFDLASSLPTAPAPSPDGREGEPRASDGTLPDETAFEPPRRDISAPEETMLIAPAPEETSQPGSGLDFEFDLDSESPRDPSAETQAISLADPDDILDIGSATVDSLEFDVKLTESTVLGQGMQHPSFDMSSISLDLDDDGGADTAAAAADASPEDGFDSDEEDTLVNPDFSAEPTDSTLNAAFASDEDLAAESEISSSEEVATKIDLARAYQEMGDLEGARELLQEVLKEGDAAQRETAQTILGGLRD